MYRFQNRHQSGYFLCDFNEAGDILLHTEFQELDSGFEFYAPQTFHCKGRNILYAWMGVMEDDKEANIPTIKSAEWVHNLSIPRKLELVGNTLVQQPVDELTRLRLMDRIVDEAFDHNVTQELSSLQVEIVIDFPDGCDQVALEVEKGFDFSFSKEEGLLTLKRESWTTGTTDVRQIRFDEGISKLQLFLDRSVMEIFVNDGVNVFSSRFFSNASRHCLKINANHAKGRLQVFNLKTVEMGSSSCPLRKGAVHGNF